MNSTLNTNEELYLKAKEAYYKGHPIITDEEFDELEELLRSEDSFVIDIVGIKSKNKLNIKHLYSMLSLDKIKFKKGEVPYLEFIHKFLSKEEGYIEFGPKLDGNAITCKYENDKLVSIASRGDGINGQDYTIKLKNKIPNTIKGFTGEIRGECVIDIELFNAKYLNKPYKNARNFVAGILNSDYSKSMLDKYNDIDFVAFDIKGSDIENHTKWLASKGFDILDEIKIYHSKDIDETIFIQIYNEFENYRKTCKYQLDGYVAKFISNEIRELLSEGNHHPNWAIAIKFITEEVKTTIINIEWNLTKTGKLSPVAILKPVELMGSTVQRASVYNASWLLKNKCLPGAEIILVKSGDIIPRIINIVKGSDEPFNFPKDWNGLNVKYNDVDLIVEGFENSNEFKSIKLYNSIVALGFKNIGPATCELLHNSGMDIYKLLSYTPEGLKMTLLQSGVFKNGRELELLIENLYELTEVHLWQVIYSTGYTNCGKTISKQLANWYTNISYDFKGLEKAIIESFINKGDWYNQVSELINILKTNNINVIMPSSDAGLISYEMTGSGEGFGFRTKSDFSYEVEKSGKCKHTSLTSTTNYLVCDSLVSMTGKMQKASKNGTKIVTYSEFLDIINNLK